MVEVKDVAWEFDLSLEVVEGVYIPWVCLDAT